MSGFESGPGFGGYEGDLTLPEAARLDMLRELAARTAEAESRNATAEVVRRPELAAMLGKIVEAGPELGADAVAHLRRMIALCYHFYDHVDRSERAELDVTFYDIVGDEVADEIEELSQMADADGSFGDMPDLWDVAYADLMRLEEGGDI